MVPMTNASSCPPLKQGAVWKMPLAILSSPEPHYVIVLNHNHVSGQVVLLSIVTSKVRKHLDYARIQGRSLSTIVQFGPKDYAELDRHSCVDCNALKPVDPTFFSQSASAPRARRCKDLPAPVLNRIITAVLNSPDVSKSIKDLVRPPDAP